MNTRIFITNLGKYNEGHLIGKWLELPATQEEIKNTLNAIGINQNYEEWFLTDYETDIDGLEIGEYSNIYTLNEKVSKIEELEKTEQEALQAFLQQGYEFDNALERVKDYDYMVYDNCEDMEDVAREYAEQVGLLSSIPENLQSYFDFKSFGNDMEYESTFIFINNNCYQIDL